MADTDSLEPLSNVSDSSFVILGQGSLPSHVNEDPVGPKESLKADSLINSRSTFSAFESVNSSTNDKFQKKSFMDGSCTSDEEIKKKLEDVVKENFYLKETLTQNNLAIKSQLDTFFTWQQEVLKTHETHKQKFLETKALILKLLAENKNLKKQNEESSLRLSNSDAEDVSGHINKNSEELDRLKEKVEEYEKICNNLISKNENLGMENQKFKEELKAGKTEILKLNKEVEDLGRENTMLKHNIDDFKKNSMGSTSPRSLPNAEARTQINNLLKQLEEEKRKVMNLREELKKLKMSDSEVTKTTAEELTECLDKIDALNSSLDMQSQRLNSLSWIALSEENLKECKIDGVVDQNLRGEINTLKSHINQEEHITKEKQKDMQELKNQFNRLLLDYKKLQLDLKVLESNESSGEKFKDEVLRLTSELKTKEKELLSKEEECENLKRVVAALEEKCQVLGLQAEVYKTDFEEEQEARRKSSTAKAELGGRIILLERRIQQLEGNTENENNPETTPQGTWICPNCFLTITLPVMEHLRECEVLDV